MLTLGPANRGVCYCRRFAAGGQELAQGSCKTPSAIDRQALKRLHNHSKTHCDSILHVNKVHCLRTKMYAAHLSYFYDSVSNT